MLCDNSVALLKLFSCHHPNLDCKECQPKHTKHHHLYLVKPVGASEFHLHLFNILLILLLLPLLLLIHPQFLYHIWSQIMLSAFSSHGCSMKIEQEGPPFQKSLKNHADDDDDNIGRC